MLERNDLQTILEVLNEKDGLDNLKKKLELIIKAGIDKENYEKSMMDIQDELRKIYDEEHKQNKEEE